MTADKTLILQFLEAQRAAIETALRTSGLVGPTQKCAYLDRLQAVGDNEPKPLVIIRRERTVTALDSSSCALDHTMQFVVLIHVHRASLLTPVSQLMDEPWQVVHSAVMAVADTLPWCQGINPLRTDPEPMDPVTGNVVAGLLVLSYNALIMTKALDLTAIP